MSTIIIAVIALAAGFIAGIFVGRKHAAAVNTVAADVAVAKSVVSKL